MTVAVKNEILGDQFTLESKGINLSVEDIYHRIQNDDVMAYLRNSKPAQTLE